MFQSFPRTIAALGKWAWLLLAAIVGTGLPPLYQASAVAALLLGYASCKALDWGAYQRLLADSIGGLCFGAGLAALVRLDRAGHTVLSLPAALVIWTIARAVFMGVEARFSSHKLRVRSSEHTERTSVSAWSGENQGQTPDAKLSWQFFAQGEIAMGGPIYGEVVFSNGIVLRAVGPAFAVSDDGKFAALPLPSRQSWGLWLLDLVYRRVHDLSEGASMWEVDAIVDGNVHGRRSPLTTNESPLS